MKHSVWKDCSPIVLASASAIRLEILRNAAIPVEVIPASIDERSHEKPLIQQGISLEKISEHLAFQKALSVSKQRKDRYVLGCDQILVFDNTLLTKSVSREIGLQKLQHMAGKSHSLISSAILVKNEEILCRVTGCVKLWMRFLSADFYQWYSENSENALTDSVGGYHFEKTGSHLFEKIEGDYFTTLGLPLLPLLTEFRRLELIVS